MQTRPSRPVPMLTARTMRGVFTETAGAMILNLHRNRLIQLFAAQSRSIAAREHLDAGTDGQHRRSVPAGHLLVVPAIGTPRSENYDIVLLKIPATLDVH